MSSETRATIVLGVTGCIAAYKACELVRELSRRNMRVKVVMTEAGARFVGSATFRALTGEPVTVSLWEDPSSARVHHVSLAEEADVVVVAPCTANTLAKIAHGRADDILATAILATRATLVLAPAMNWRMWRAEVTQANVSTLAERGAVIVPPESGELACGEEGPGRLAEVSVIADAVEAEACRVRSLEGIGILITASGTREPLDEVRFVGNSASGKTGFALADEAARRGARVTLVSGPTWLEDPPGVRVVRVTTAAEMREAVLAEVSEMRCVIMTAAVADVRPARSVPGKVPKREMSDVLELEPTPDILAELGSAKHDTVLIGFVAECGDPVPSAKDKLLRKNLDMVVANDVSRPGLGPGADSNQVTLVGHDSVEELEVMSKRRLAAELLDRVARLLASDTRR